MRQDPDIALVRTAFERYHKGDLKGVFALAAPDVVFEPVLMNDRFEGKDAVRNLFGGAVEDPRANWLASELEFSKVGDAVIASGKLETLGASGMPMTVPVAWLIHVRDGLIARMEGYLSKRQAERAARASEQS
jgi:ketosteroid isomerase-like protein